MRSVRRRTSLSTQHRYTMQLTTTYAVAVVAFVAPQCTYVPVLLNTSGDDTRQCMYVLQCAICPCMTLHLQASVC